MPTNAEAQSVTVTSPAPSASSRSRSAGARAVVSNVAIVVENAVRRPFVRNACGTPRMPTLKAPLCVFERVRYDRAVLRRVTLILGVAAGLLLASAPPASAVQPYPLNFQTVDFTSGTLSGLDLSGGKLKLATNGLGSFSYTDPFSSLAVLGHSVDGSGGYVSGTWTSPVYPINFPFNELVSSWNSKTPPGTWIQSEVKPQLDNGHWAKWYILG